MGASIRLGIVGGAGWLGGAIAGAALAAGVVRADTLALSYRRAKPDRFAGAFWTHDNQALADRCDVIMLSVRPQDWPPLAIDARGKQVISVMAGSAPRKSLERIQVGRTRKYAMSGHRARSTPSGKRSK